MLLFGEHEDGEDQLRGEDGFDEDTPRERGVGGERGAHVELCWEQHFDDVGCEDGAGELGDEEERGADEGDAAGEQHGECDLERA